MKNDKTLSAGVESGLSKRERISETSDALGMTHTNDRTGKPKGGLHKVKNKSGS